MQYIKCSLWIQYSFMNTIKLNLECPSGAGRLVWCCFSVPSSSQEAQASSANVYTLQHCKPFVAMSRYTMESSRPVTSRSATTSTPTKLSFFSDEEAPDEIVVDKLIALLLWLKTFPDLENEILVLSNMMEDDDETDTVAAASTILKTLGTLSASRYVVNRCRFCNESYKWSKSLLFIYISLSAIRHLIHSISIDAPLLPPFFLVLSADASCSAAL